MKTEKVEYFKKVMQSKSTEELAQMWRARSGSNYSKEALEAIRQLLKERGQLTLSPREDSSSPAGEREAVPSRRVDPQLFCTKCGVELPPESSFCSKCGSPVRPKSTSIKPREVPRIPKRPWYFSDLFLILTFLFVTPIGAGLILADKQQRRWVKVIVGIIGLGSVVYFGYFFLGAPFTSTMVGPGRIEFSSDYVESAGSISITEPKSTFSPGEQFAWVARLRGSAKTTRLNLVLSRITSSGGEQVIDRNVMDIADPKFDTVFGKSPSGIKTGSGRYKFRVMSGDNILAEGEFEMK
jgi:ribosomal protein L40E